MQSLLDFLRYIRRKIFNLYGKYVYWLSLRGDDVPVREDGESCELYLVTIAYNKENLIRKQIEMVKSFVTDVGYHHVVVDNSPDKKKRRLIQNVCADNGIEYVPIPRYIDRLISTRLFGYGISHGAALNWMFYKYLLHRKPVRFALLDHDIFPIKQYNFVEALGDRAFYGVKRDRAVGWYLWPGFCIFRLDAAFPDCKPNFLPMIQSGVFLDAGGANYPLLYKNYDIAQVDFPEDTTYRLKKTEGLIDIYHGDCISIVDIAWLHLINGSNYANIRGKEEFMEKVMANIEKLQKH